MDSKKIEKRGKKRKSSVRRSNSIGEDQSYTDFLCPICLQILIEPVQMPCNHELCMQCFKTHVESTSLTCPMCRLRISIWVRKNTKSNTLINEERWKLIKRVFPERVQRRLDGGDDLDCSYSEYNAPVHVIATDGEVRKEYEEELKKIEEERNAMTQANIEYIQKLQQEEQEARKKQEELDRATAHALQKEEMKHLGVKPMSPSRHQSEVLALLKPKSPMKLRDRTLTTPEQNNSSKNKSSRQHKIISPSHTITTFFKRKTISPQNSRRNQSSTKNVSKNVSNSSFSTSQRTGDSIPCSSKNIVDMDCDFARQLQERFDKEMEWVLPELSPKRPLRTQNINTKLSTTKLSGNIDVDANLKKNAACVKLK